MLPKENQKLEYLREESAYFTNQSWKECRRVVMLDYALGREHFVDMGEQMHRHIYEINLAWGQFLDFYTDLNNARKEKDDSYAELNHIGEDVIEPDEPGMGQGAYDSAKPTQEIKDQVAEQLDNEESTENILEELKEDNQESKAQDDLAPPKEVEIGKKIKVKKSKVIMQD